MLAGIVSLLIAATAAAIGQAVHALPQTSSPMKRSTDLIEVQQPVISEIPNDLTLT